MKELVEELKDQIKDSVKFDEDPEEKSWGLQEGILLSRNEAIAIVDFIDKVDTSAQQE